MTMRSRLLLGLALGAFAVSATAAHAQKAVTPERDLRCAAVIMLLGGMAKDERQTTGFAAGFSYFIGRWEGATGRNFEEALTPEYVMETSKSLGTYQKECSVRMVSFGDRLIVLGRGIQEKAASAK
ncbi:MAG: hypothetical protein RL299_191 [Pseudomonadota bacterium]|jgi:hypothetical protein